MSHIQLNAPAPDFNMADYLENTFQLSALKGSNNVLLVFNRSFL